MKGIELAFSRAKNLSVKGVQWLEAKQWEKKISMGFII